MTYDRNMIDLPEPPSRHERQQQTRAALIEAGREVFAELGYHAANLDRIARQAGFSKGAVYSNFSGKAALFLAVMDANLQSVWSQPWGTPETFRKDVPPPEVADDKEEAELEELIRGFALATLEFIAVAARDEELSGELQQRIQDVVDQYTEVAKTARIEHDELSPEQIGTLLTALDQGSGLLLLGGTGMLDDALWSVGMQRLLSPSHDDGEKFNSSAATGNEAENHIHERLMKALRRKP